MGKVKLKTKPATGVTVGRRSQRSGDWRDCCNANGRRKDKNRFYGKGIKARMQPTTQKPVPTSAYFG